MTAQSTNGKAAEHDKWAALREPFPPEAIGKKPQPLRKNADKGHCDECGKTHGLPAIHIDYVGHAYVTERIVTHDPAYAFDGVAHDEHGLPVFLRGEDSALKLYGELTIFGVSKRDWGEGDDEKACWSDTLKRCAMRFGIGIDLWKKETSSEEVRVEVEPEETFGPCPACGAGQIVKRKKRDGQEYAKCSLSNYKDKRTCQWVDWEPDFEAYEHRAASKESTDDAPANDAERPAVPPARTNGATRAIPQPVAALAEQSGKLPWDE